MEWGGEGKAARVLDAFRGGGFVELLGAGGSGGVRELLGMEGVDVERAVRVVEGEEDGEEGILLRCPPPYPPPSPSSYRMLCFGGDDGFPHSGNNGFPLKSSESSSSTTSSSSNSSPSKLKKKTEERKGHSAATEQRTKMAAEATASKKPRREQPQRRPHPPSQRRASKVRKESLGERIAALQQLVSPFGKSDTASVLHEALGYIRFLHDQVQVLSSPYLQRLPSSADHLHVETRMDPRLDLRSRGLCLVPLACTANMAASNGADFWSPATGSGGDRHHPSVFKH